MASIAVLPVLIGLAVDYAIQFQARFDESGARRARRRASRAVSAAARGRRARRSPRRGWPRRSASSCCCCRPCRWCAASALLLVVGIARGAVLRALRRLRGPRALPRPGAPAAARAAAARLAAPERTRACTGAREWLADRSWRALGVSLARPRRVLAIGLAVAVLGLALDTQSEVVSDIRELVPQDLQALRDVNELQDETGVSGEIDVTVRADDITDPEVIAWMTRFQDRVLRAHGYRDGKRCGQARNPPELCPALSLPGPVQQRRAATRRRCGSCSTPCPPTSLRAW